MTGVDIMKKFIYVSCGFITLFLGLLGIILPVLPTTPLIMLSMFCFTKGATRIASWLNKTMGRFAMKKNVIKMILDIIMIVILAMLYNSHVAALSFHEIAGLGVFGLFIIHCILNLKWITGISKRFFSKSLAPKVRIGYIVNLLLAVTFIFIIISGICTSQVLFPSNSHGSVWRGIHHFCGAISIILVGIHVGLHWTFISSMFKKVVPMKDGFRKIVARILLVMVLSLGIYSITTSSFTNWLIEPFVTQTKDQSEHMENSSPATDENKLDSMMPEKSEDGKTGGNTNEHSGKDGENKAAPSVEAEIENNKAHDGESKTVETNVGVILGTIAKFISIMGLFASITYYIVKKLFATKYMEAM